MRAVLTMLTSLAVLATSPGTGIAQNNLVGMKWKLNLEKSKFSPGPPPKGSVLTYEAVDGAFKIINEAMDAQGTPVKGTFGPYKLDGKPYPVVGVPSYDGTSYKMVNDTTAEVIRTKGDKPVQTGTRVLSADGKTLTFSFKGINAKGEQIDDVAVYDRQ